MLIKWKAPYVPTDCSPATLEKCYKLRFRSHDNSIAGSHVKVKVIEMKEKGNAAFKNREYEEALIFYNRAISMMKGYENLTREAAIVLTNRSIVHSNLHSVTEALEDAEEAVRCDPTWMKVCQINQVSLKYFP